MGSRTCWLTFLVTMIVTMLCLKSCSLLTSTENDLDIPNSSVPKPLIVPGESGEDRVPAIDSPKFEDVQQVRWLRNQHGSQNANRTYS